MHALHHYLRARRKLSRRVLATGFLLTAGALANCAWAGSTPATPAITAVKALPDSRINITGYWPNACVPHIALQDHEDSILRLYLRDSGRSCSEQSHRFTLSVPNSGFSPASPPGIYRVEIYTLARRGQDMAPTLVGVRQIDTRHLDITPETGFWWPSGDHEGSGESVSLEIQGDSLGVAWLSYDAGGAPVWYFGTGHLVGNIAHLALTRMSRNEPQDVSSQALKVQPVVDLDLAFIGSTHARVVLSRDSADGDLAVSEFDLARVAFSSESTRNRWTGKWLLATDQATSSLPRSLDLDDGAQGDDDNRFTLSDGQRGYALACASAADAAADDPVRSCVLYGPERTPLARFDNIGLDRLAGSTEDGADILLLRPR